MTQSLGSSRLNGYDFTRIKALTDQYYVLLPVSPANGDTLVYNSSTQLWEASGQQTYNPTLQGATDNPTVNYSVRIGRYQLIGKTCRFGITIVTSSITKTTLTDAIRVTLPSTARNTSGFTQITVAAAYNATPVQSANIGIIEANRSYLTFSQQSLTGTPTGLTYDLVNGIGVLTNTITFQANGTYEIN